MNLIQQNSKLFRQILLVATVYVWIASPLHAALADINIDADNADHAYTFILNNAVNETIAVIGANTPNVFWDFDGGTPAPVVGAGFTMHNVTVTLPAVPPANASSGSVVTLSGNPTSSGSFSFTLIVTEDGGASSETRTYHVTIRAPLDLGLVLDRSGSMAWGYDGNFSPPANARRWDGLLTGVGLLADSLSIASLVTSDRIGLRFFASNTITPAAPFNGAMIPMMANVGGLEGNVAGQSPSGSTALGDGIITVRDILLASNPTNRKVMIVFSDGVQNAGDQVRLPPHANAYLETGNSKQLNGNSDEIDIHTICLGSSGHNPTLMQEIAGHNGGTYMNTLTGAEVDFSTYFTTLLINILSGSTPQYVENSKGAFQIPGPGQPAQMEAAFDINNGVSQVNIFLLSPTNREPHFTALTKDGSNLLQFGHRRSGPGFIAMTLRQPLTGSGVTNLGGAWKLSAQAIPRGTTPYTLLVVVDDHQAELTYRLGDETPHVDDVLQISMSATWKDKSISNGNAQAVILKPGDDINDLLAVTDVKFDAAPTDPGSPDAAKLAALMQDQTFLDKIKAKNQLVNLTYQAGDSIYTGTFSPLDLTGVYQVIYQFSSDNSEYGKLRRYHHKSFNVRFKDINLSASDLQVSVDASNNTVLSFRPRASNGRYIGPGWGAVIALVSPGASIQSYTDHGDGRYDLVISGSLTGSGVLSVSDEEVFNGNLGDLGCYGTNQNFLQKIRCLLISLGLPGWIIWLVLLLILLLLWLIFRKKKP